MPIFETLAAMTDWIDDKNFNFSPVSADARAMLADLTQTATAKTVVEDITTGAVLPIENESLTKASVTVTNNKNTVYDKHIIGILNKTPRSTVEGQFTNNVY